MKYTHLALVFAGMFAITNAHAISVNDSTDGILAKVNDEVILKSEFLSASQTLANQYKAQNLNISREQLQSRTLDELITRKLQLDIIHRSGFRPDESAINRQLMQIAQSQGFNSLSEFQKHLDTQKLGSYVALRHQLIEDASLVALWQAQVAPRIKINDQEIDAFLASLKAKNCPAPPFWYPNGEPPISLPRLTTATRLPWQNKKSKPSTPSYNKGQILKTLPPPTRTMSALPHKMATWAGLAKVKWSANLKPS